MSDRHVTVPIASLVEDFDLYPRHHVDGAHVAQMVAVLEAGGTLPPPLIVEGTGQIADGFHRVRARRKHHGPGSEIDVIMRSYDDPAEIIADAVQANAEHGRKLDSRDRTRSALLLAEAGFDLDETARILRTTPQRVQQLTSRVVVVGRGKTAQTVPAKPVAWPKDGKPRRLTQAQAEAMRSFPGLRPAQLARQLRDAIVSGLVDLDDHTTSDALRELYDALADALSERAST